MVRYSLEFLPTAEKEWKKLDGTVKAQLFVALEKRLITPHVPSAALRGMKNCYKIKLRKIGYRLVYQVNDAVVTVTVIAVGRRDGDVYADAVKRQ